LTRLAAPMKQKKRRLPPDSGMWRSMPTELIGARVQMLVLA